MAEHLRIVVIGGVAAGPKAAARARRLLPDAEITIVERDEFLSYAGCGLPYYISGAVKEQAELMETPIGVLRDPAFFKKVKAIEVLNHTEATRIDRDAKVVEVRNLLSGETSMLPYDKLVIATGARLVEPPIEGKDLTNVFRLKDVHDAEAIKAMIGGACRRAAIIGGGLIGMEMTEAFQECGKMTTIVELLPHIMSMLDSDMAALVEQYLRSIGVTVMTGAKVLRLEGDGNGNVCKVVTDKGEVDTELVLMSVGIRPETTLAEQAGLLIGPSGGVHVNEYMQTSDRDIYAVGDCAEKRCFVAGLHCFLPLGSVANREGRIAGTNVAGGAERSPGVTSALAVKVFDWNVGRAGMTVQQARQIGHDVVSVLVPSPDRAHFYPGAKPIYLKLVVERATRRLVGIQGVGPGEVVKRIDVAVTAMAAGMTVDDVANLDLAYAPPFSSAMDPLITAANTARNLLDGLYQSTGVEEVHAMMEAGEDFFLLDVRSPGEYEQARIPGATLIPLGALRSKTAELPRDKPIVAFCKTSLRAYEAARYLHHVGFTDVRVMQGGIMAWTYGKETAA
jgi:NADPH-dependent 2,4-dienoyl-CoA reductase/sulfur reductase-like enzyme/rhodanese-related sulfurtransferase